MVIDSAPRDAGLVARASAPRPRWSADTRGGARRPHRSSLSSTALLATPAWSRAPRRRGLGGPPILVAARAARIARRCHRQRSSRRGLGGARLGAAASVVRRYSWRRAPPASLVAVIARRVRGGPADARCHRRGRSPG